MGYNAMDEKLSLQNGAAFMDKCLDAALNEQRSVAHGAIDMDDWSKAQEILSVAKRNISLIEDLRAKFSEYKKSVDAAVETIGGGADSGDKSAEVKENASSSESTPEEAADEPMAGDEFLAQLEELIIEYSYAMAVVNEAAGIGDSFTYNDEESKSMKNPAKLSNSLWVDTAIPKSKADELVKAVREYCSSKA